MNEDGNEGEENEETQHNGSCPRDIVRNERVVLGTPLT
jgi:hypothetical protein